MHVAADMSRCMELPDPIVESCNCCYYCVALFRWFLVSVEVDSNS
jgi:hypothetical protein